jgi:ferredoxin
MKCVQAVSCVPTKQIEEMGMSGEVTLKVVINKPACCGYGVCADICPEVFKLDENGIVFVESDLVPVSLEDAAREAVDACPQSALALVAA